jgi:hypothetical protein
VAHACNPSYSGGRNQQDQGLKLVPARADRVAQGARLEFKPQYSKKKGKKQKVFQNIQIGLVMLVSDTALT